MTTTTIICPSCARPLKSTTAVPAGKRVRCPGCGASFIAAPPAAGVVRPEQTVTPPVRPPEAYSPPENWWVQPGGAAPKTPPPVIPMAAAVVPHPPAAIPVAIAPPPLPVAAGANPGRHALVAGLALAGSLLVLGGGLALALHVANQKDSQAAPVGHEPAAELTPRPEAPEERPPSPLPNIFGERPGRPSRPRQENPAPPRADPVERQPAPPPLPDTPPRPLLPKEEQARVDKAIDQGIEYLRKGQKPDGGWGNGPVVGYSALPGLTLLECGVPADDPQVLKAAELVRGVVPTLQGTYEMALAILFLDRLGDPKDSPLIQTMALRLVAGQSVAGGWTYTCRVLTPQEERDLLTALQQLRPRSPLGLFVPDGTTPPDLFIPGPDGKLPGLTVPAPGGKPGDTVVPQPELGGPLKDEAQRDRKPEAPPGGTDSRATEPPVSHAKVIEKLPPSLKKVASLQPPGKTKDLPPHDQSDNSNTQFAILGLWAAQRHDVPLERPLALIVKRFRNSQSGDGNWGYQYSPRGSNGTPAMTCAGLLGLAVGYGLAAAPQGPARKSDVQDPAIQKGLKALAQHVGAPQAARGKNPRARNQNAVNFYFMWSLERVGVLYNLPTLGEKDWYAWGAELLVDHQQPGGHWQGGNYHGATPIIDTCFALLFLKRANFTKDLSNKLEFLIQVKDLGEGR
jgi:hypothetical protein